MPENDRLDVLARCPDCGSAVPTKMNSGTTSEYALPYGHPLRRDEAEGIEAGAVDLVERAVGPITDALRGGQ